MFDIKSVAKKLGTDLPKELNILNVYDLGSLNIKVKEGEFSPLNITNYVYTIPTHLIKKDILVKELLIYSFRENEKLHLYWQNRINSDLWNTNENFLDLAVLRKPSEHFVVLSLNENSFGTIWKENPYDNFSRVLIADNLIQFLGGLHFSLTTGFSKLYEPIHEKLYKNWGEDFWRLREESE